MGLLLRGVERLSGRVRPDRGEKLLLSGSRLTNEGRQGPGPEGSFKVLKPLTRALVDILDGLAGPGRVIPLDSTMASDSQVSVLLRSGSMCGCLVSCRELQRYPLAIRGHVPRPVVEVSLLGVRFA